MLFGENELLLYADKMVCKSGVRCYEHGLVKDFNVHIKPWDNKGTKAYEIDAWVGSSDGSNKYNVQVKLNDKTGFTAFACNCRFFHENYRRRGICKHIVAVLTKYCRDKERYVKDEINTFELNKLISNIRENKDLGDRQEVKLLPRYEFHSQGKIKSSLEIKIGTDRFYQIRDIRAFLDAYETGSQIIAGKDFLYSKLKYSFNELDIKFINFIREIRENESLFKKHSDYPKDVYKLLDGKNIYPSEIGVKRIFELYEHEGINCTIDSKNYGTVPIYKDVVPLDLKVATEGNNYSICYDSYSPLAITTKGDILFYKEAIYILNDEKLASFKLFYDILNKEDKIIINSGNKDNLMKVIIPEINRMSGNINIDNSARKELDIDSLRIEFYVDKVKDQILITLRFNYGKIGFNALENFDTKKIIRDKDSEFQAIQVIENLSFERRDTQFLLSDEEKIYSFLQSGASLLRNYGEVFYSDNFKNLKLYNSSHYKGEVRLNEKGLLEFDFSIEGVDPKELWNIFRNLKSRKKYHRLSNGDFVSLQQKELEKVYELLEYDEFKFKRDNYNNIILPRYKGYFIKDEELRFIKNKEKLNDAYKLDNITGKQKDKLPKEISSILRLYQKQAFQWFNTLSENGFGGILADEMGLGKTLQAITFLYYQKNRGTSLVIAPSSLIYNWKDEIEKFLPQFKVCVVDGTKVQREKIIQEYNKYELLITSYALLRRDQEAYEKNDINCLIVDEAQYIKNPTSMNAKACKSINSRCKFALTGTPIENNLGDLWSIFDFIMPGYLLSRKRFTIRYETPIVKESNTGALEEFNRRVSPFILRREKKMVAKELPPKIEHNVLVELDEKQKKVYSAYAKAVKKDFKKLDLQVNTNKIKFLGALTRLRQICSAPEVAFEDYIGDNAKLNALLDIIHNAKENHKKVIVFSSFTSVLKIIGSKLVESSIDYCYLDGDTKVKDRVPMVNEFNEGKSEVFLISLKAGGTGLNITSAEVVVHYDPWWNPAVEEQATDRAHRIGQKNKVEVIRLIARGTIEERIYELQNKKRNMVELVVGNDSIEDYKLDFENIKNFI